MKRLMAISAAAVVTAGASAQSAVQWRVEDGGNGHWYEFIPYGLLTDWTAASIAASARGGHLATLRSGDEQSFAFHVCVSGGCEAVSTIWLGASQDAGASPASGWRWITNEPWSFTNWSGGEPNDYAGWEEDCLVMFSTDGTWNDTRKDGLLTSPGCTRAALYEWSADCNSDGIVDFGQILAGELPDANHNNIPDCCEAGPPCDCPGDTNNDGAVNGIDLATILTRWAQPAAKFPSADCNRDGVIDGSDLAIVLGSWGVCP